MVGFSGLNKKKKRTYFLVELNYRRSRPAVASIPGGWSSSAVAKLPLYPLTHKLHNLHILNTENIYRQYLHYCTLH